uniref:E4 n=1 Tax=Human papillomavirus TaxID=10566 RepID=A0A1Q1PPA5_9PAPI|nr:E4 [Human papillomavirus]QAB13975.1 MAG: E4 protein [Human papillomavirus]
MKLLSPLSPALQSLPLHFPGKPTAPPFPTPPKTPYPHRKAQDDSKSRRSVPVPGRRHLQEDDDDENKENEAPKLQHPPLQREEEPEDEEEDQLCDLSRLLKRLAQDIDRYQEQVYRDLGDLRKKLGILQS